MDLEFNQAFDFGGGMNENENLRFEIIQLGAVIMDERFEATGRRNILVKPTVYPRMHPVVRDMTGLTNAFLDRMPPFPQVFEEIAALLAPGNVMCTWGGSDVRLLFDNIRFYGFDASLVTNAYINVQLLASQYLNHGAGRQIGLRSAVEELGVDAAEPFHNALNDAFYTSKVFEIVRREGMEIRTYVKNI